MNKKKIYGGKIETLEKRTDDACAYYIHKRVRLVWVDLACKENTGNRTYVVMPLFKNHVRDENAVLC